MTTAGKEKVKGWLKKSLFAGFFWTGDGRMSDSARRKSAVQGIGHQQSPTDCWPFARAYVTLNAMSDLNRIYH